MKTHTKRSTPVSVVDSELQVLLDGSGPGLDVSRGTKLCRFRAGNKSYTGTPLTVTATKELCVLARTEVGVEALLTVSKRRSISTPFRISLGIWAPYVRIICLSYSELVVTRTSACQWINTCLRHVQDGSFPRCPFLGV